MPASLPKPRYIVAEVTKTWTRGDAVRGLISQRFEEVVNVNASRGYHLYHFSHSTIITPDGAMQQETIIAVFQLREPPP